MNAVFLKLLNMSIAAGWLVLAAVLFRLVFKKAPKRLRCLVWALVALRLVLPFTIESPLGIVPEAAIHPAETEVLPITADKPAEPRPQTAPELQAELPSDSGVIYSMPTVVTGARVQPEQVQEGTIEEAPSEPEKKLSVISVLSAVWLAGAIAMALYSVISFLCLKKSIRGYERLFDNVVLCDRAPTPFIFGFLRPLIVLPSTVSEEDAPFALVHEKAHIERRDHLIKPFGFALLTIYWFNPLIWLAYVLLCRDIELACDERVINKFGSKIKKGYSAALINCSAATRSIKACPVAFGEVGIKTRVRSVLNYKRSTAVVILAALMAFAAIGVFLLPARAEKAAEEKQEEPKQAEQAIPSEKEFDRIYLLGDDCNKASPMRILISTAEKRYVVIEKKGSRLSVADSGVYTLRSNRYATFISDSGFEREFFTWQEKLSLIRTSDERRDTVFPIGGQWQFCLYKGETKLVKYFYSQGSCYVWYLNDNRLLVIGDPKRVEAELMKDEFFCDDPFMAEELSNALSDLDYPNCEFCISQFGIARTGLVFSYEQSVNIFSKGSMLSNYGLVVTVNSTPLSGKSTGLTPGSRFVRGGYKGYQ